MKDNLKFPNGYDVTICRKRDILECIDKNIVDKDVAMAIIDDLEFQAASFITEGRWTGIPYIGNIRIPKIKKILQSTEQQALINEAKEQLDKEQYILFRKKLNLEIAKQVKYERYYKYITSIAINKNRPLYKKLCSTKGEAFARLYLYSCNIITAVNNEYINLIEDEQFIINR